MNPAAPHHLPPFITAPGETDVLMVVMAVFLLLAVVGIGVLYLKLHALPEQMAHRGQKVQFEIVAVLALLALFTHNHVFWIAGLLARPRAAAGLPHAGDLDGAVAGQDRRARRARGSGTPACPGASFRRPIGRSSRGGPEPCWSCCSARA